MKKKYWLILVLLFLVGLDWYIRAPDSRSRELTATIEKQGSAQLKAYPYQFHVMAVTGDSPQLSVQLSTPRSFAVPAYCPGTARRQRRSLGN